MVEPERRIEVAINQAIRQRNYRRVRDRALARLSAIYKEQYLELLEEERQRDEQEGKVWLDITGRTNPNGGSPTAGGKANQVTNRLGNQGSPRNLGAEA